MSALDPRIARWMLWLAPFALLVLAIGIQTGWGRDLKPAPLAEAPVVPAPVTTAVAPEFRIDGGLDAMKSTVERPLFNSSRRPAPPAVAEGAKPTIQRGQFVLTGTLITDKGAVAYLKEAGGAGKSRSVKKGDSINGMVVAEVAPDRVKLTVGDESEDVELKVAKGPKTTVQTGAVAAAPAGAPAAQPAGAPVPPGAGAPTRRAATQATQGATQDAQTNVRNARRSAREAERQQGAAPTDGTQPPAATNTPQPANTWQDTYQRMQRRR
ncbi:MAG TPA: hypothetical protein VII68_04770 [Casimicrobiaceae bacterium]|jgi:hypothetical protein